MIVERPILLLVLDGWGIGKEDVHNAIYQANTPHMDRLLAEYANTTIGAAGEYIGLTPGHQGSTEIGHLILSAGRNVLLPQTQIKQAIASGAVFTNTAYRDAVRMAKERGSRLHIMGLLSDAGVHSYDVMCHELLELAAKEGLAQEQVLIHVFSDGRDTAPTSLSAHVKRLQAKMKSTGVGVIASLQGRFWVMDRDHRWERVEAAYRLLTVGAGKRSAASIEQAIQMARENNETDEFISPTSIAAEGYMKDNDVVINYNYRVDREIEITKALIEPEFEAFMREAWPQIHYVATLPYYADIKCPYAFEREELKMKNILPEILSKHGYSQYRLTETEKWVYVTKIFNGMHEETYHGETRHVIPSDKVLTYDEKPEMKAIEIANDAVKQLRTQFHDVFIMNMCNADIMGHTGNRDAAIIGCQTIDTAIGLLVDEVKKQHAILMITADHGHAEDMWDHRNGQPHTQHTANPVPFILVDAERKNISLRKDGSLRDVAPTILSLLGIEKPEEMTGRSLIE